MKTARKRTYQSPLRQEQAAATRTRIMEALAAEFAGGTGDLSIAAVAHRAGVSVRTVYHHFPDRDAQIEALARWLDERVVASDPGPAGPDDLVDYAGRMVRVFNQHEPWMRAQLAPGLARLVRARRRKKRERAVDAAVAEVAPDPRQAHITAALMKAIIAADFAVTLKDDYGVADEELVAAGTFAVRALLEALREGRGPAC